MIRSIIKFHRPVCLPRIGEKSRGAESRVLRISLRLTPQPLARRLGHAQRPPGRMAIRISSQAGFLRPGTARLGLDAALSIARRSGRARVLREFGPDPRHLVVAAPSYIAMRGGLPKPSFKSSIWRGRSISMRRSGSKAAILGSRDARACPGGRRGRSPKPPAHGFDRGAVRCIRPACRLARADARGSNGRTLAAAGAARGRTLVCGRAGALGALVLARQRRASLPDRP